MNTKDSVYIQKKWSQIQECSQLRESTTGMKHDALCQTMNTKDLNH